MAVLDRPNLFCTSASVLLLAKGLQPGKSIVIELHPTELAGHGVRLEPLHPAHADGLRAAASDGELWKLFFTLVPKPDETESYIEQALSGYSEGHMLPWVVRDDSEQIIGSTRYHDILPQIDRVEIGYTWYAASRHRSHVNTACKLLLLTHAFESLACAVVGLRTDSFNFRSQRAIESLGAKKDGTLRHHAIRRDGSVRSTVFYSILATEWDDVKKHLQTRLWRHGQSTDSAVR